MTIAAKKTKTTKILIAHKMHNDDGTTITWLFYLIYFLTSVPVRSNVLAIFFFLMPSSKDKVIQRRRVTQKKTSTNSNKSIQRAKNHSYGCIYLLSNILYLCFCVKRKTVSFCYLFAFCLFGTK